VTDEPKPIAEMAAATEQHARAGGDRVAFLAGWASAKRGEKPEFADRRQRGEERKHSFRIRYNAAISEGERSGRRS
jgi:hypothetical protein